VNWGDLQSVVQLAVALNTIYLSLKDIRTPAVRNEQDALGRIRQDLANVREHSDRLSEPLKNNLGKTSRRYTDLFVQFTDRINRFDDQDAQVRVLCLISIILYIFLLIGTTFFYNSKIEDIFTCPIISKSIESVICLLGFLPITYGLWINLELVRYFRKYFKVSRLNVEGELLILKNSLI
jgi:hypothetical protein